MTQKIQEHFHKQNVDQINQWYLPKIEASCHSLYFKVVQSN